jgi:hypothetical protein
LNRLAPSLKCSQSGRPAARLRVKYPCAIIVLVMIYRFTTLGAFICLGRRGSIAAVPAWIPPADR